MSINDKTKSALIRKGNELFNERKIEEAYRCYLTASYFGGIENLSQSVAKVLQKWLNDDETFNNSKTNKLSLDSKNTYLPNNYKRNSLEDILNAKDKLDKEKLDKDKLNKTKLDNDKINKNYNDNKIIKKPIFEQIYKSKNK